MSTEWCEFQETATSSLILQHSWSLSCISVFWKSTIFFSFTEVHVSYSFSWTFPECLPGSNPLCASYEALSALSAHGCPWITTERCWVPATPSEVNGNSMCSAFLQRVAKRDGDTLALQKKLQAEGGSEGKKMNWSLPTSHFFTSPCWSNREPLCSGWLCSWKTFCTPEN